MSYYLEVIKDTPYGIYMMTEPTLFDWSGFNRAGGIVGTLLPGPPLVAGVDKSGLIETGTYGAVPFPYLTPGQERQPATIETWFEPIGGTQGILAVHYTDLDGLYWNGYVLSFGIKLSTGYVTVNYTPQVLSKMHVVGVYTGTSLQLYVNGELKSSKLLTDLELATPISIVSNDGNFWIGNSPVVQQALAFYQYALPQDRILAHYKAGNDSSGSRNAAGIFGGKYVEINRKTANIFYQKTWGDWTQGQSTAPTSETGVSSAVDPVTGDYIASTWQDSFELDSGGTSIDGVQIEYDGDGVFTIETSLDNGTTWSSVQNTRRISGITSGYDPIGKIVVVRVTFTAGSYGKLTFLRLSGIKDLTISTPATFPIILPANTNFFEDKEINEKFLTTGIELISGSISIGPNTEEDASGYKSINFWYYTPSGTLSTNFAGTFYENGITMTARTVTSRWTMVTITNPTEFTSAITIGGNYMRLANISLYEDELSQDQINDIEAAYVGNITRVSSSTANLATISEQDASVYAADWSIAPAG